MYLALNSSYTAVAITPDGEWTRLKNGSLYGYIQTKYLSKRKTETAAEEDNNAESSESASGTANEIVSLAKSLLGIPYVYGAESPSDGFDCSGFTWYVFKKIKGISLPRTAYSQGYDSSYPKVSSRSDLRVGDLVFFDTVSDSDLCDHAGIYIGSNQFIHASSGGGKVIISSLGSSSSDYYYRTYSWGRRVLP